MSDTQHTEERIERINQALDSEGFSFDEDTLGAYLIDEEGERAGRISSDLVEVIDTMTAEQIRIVLREVYLARIASNQQQFQAGKAAGRREIVSTVHELLGIGRIVDALERSDAHL
jgi:acetolactate synthase small subunit